MNRGLPQMIQRAILGGGASAGCSSVPVANARQRLAVRGAAPGITRDLVVPDVTIGGRLTSRAGALAYDIEIRRAPGGELLSSRKGELKLDDLFFEQADRLGRALARSVCETPLHPTLIGAGSIAGCGATAGDSATAALLGQNPDAVVFTLGDNAYPNGQPSDYASCYQPTWGTYKDRTRPIPGDQDTKTIPGGAPPNQGFSEYFRSQLRRFGPTATDRRKSYYSYDLGSWHVVALNSTCYRDFVGCNVREQERWFRRDLSRHPNACSLVMWHNVRWSSGSVHGSEPTTQPLWQIAYDAGVDVVLTGNEHDYERFAPQDAAGKLDPKFGVRAFVVGTGGYYLYPKGSAQANSEVFSSTYGVIKLTLRPQSYDWQFLPAPGQSFSDSGTGGCHGPPAR